MSKKNAILLLAEGAEEMEAVSTVDILRRAGVDVTIASITGDECVKCSRGVKIFADAKFETVKNKDYDAVILPGGLGSAKALQNSKDVGELLKKQEASGKIIAAICAAPVALKTHGIALGKKITSYPSFKDEFTEAYKYIDDHCVVDGNIITGQGPASAINFGLGIVEKLFDKNSSSTVAKGMCYANYS